MNVTIFLTPKTISLLNLHQSLNLQYIVEFMDELEKKWTKSP